MSKTNLGKVSICPKGKYDSTATYSALDVVSYGTASWMALQGNKGVTPTEGAYWMKLVDIAEEGIWEKIATFTTTEDADEVAYTQDNDGNEFKLLRALIDVKVPSTSKLSLFTGCDYVNRWGSKYAIASPYFLYADNYYLCSGLHVYQQGGYWQWQGYTANASHAARTMQGINYGNLTTYTVASRPYLNRISVYKNSGGTNTPVPAGTQIILYGIRA